MEQTINMMFECLKMVEKERGRFNIKLKKDKKGKRIACINKITKHDDGIVMEWWINCNLNEIPKLLVEISEMSDEEFSDKYGDDENVECDRLV